jgi:hypothetical protein
MIQIKVDATGFGAARRDYFKGVTGDVSREGAP